MFQDRLPQNFQPVGKAATGRDSVWAALRPSRWRHAHRLGVSAVLALADIVTILTIGLIAEYGYPYATNAPLPALSESLGFGVAALLASIVLVTNLVREEYSVDSYLTFSPQLGRTAALWLTAWAGALAIGFATKTTHDFSRVVALVFFAGGLPALLFVRAAMVRVVRRIVTPASASVSRVHLVGYEDDITQFYANNDTEAFGLRVVGTSYLRRTDPRADEDIRQGHLAEDLDLAVSVVRFLRPDDVFVLVPWSQTSDIERCIDAFLRVPAALHLRPGTMLDRFPDLQVARVGRLSGLNIGRRPLTMGEVVLKRAFDLVASSVALVLLVPLLIVVALLIKLDSPGPVFFRQRRYGFNQQAFGVFKFRSMKVQKDDTFVQATRNDARITRLGAVLRRTNIDELPQLLNVLLGDMSLVGPRPHALAHDRSFERRIALYARRHNVMPGITGWAQVNGFRGETLTDADMEKRVNADLHYIDNWSFWFDLRIMLQTVISPRAYKNAR